MERNVEIYFKVDGLEKYITNLDDLDSALKEVKGQTEKVTESTDDLERGLERSRDKVNAFKGAVDILGGSVEIVVGGLGLLGAEPKWLENIEDGALKALTFADGLSRVADGVNDVREFLGKYIFTQKASTLETQKNTTSTITNTTATRAQTTAVRAQDKATKQATKSTKLLGKALNSTNLILLAVTVIIGEIIYNWDKLMDLIGMGTKEYEDANKTIIRGLEKEQALRDIVGQTEIERADRQVEIDTKKMESAASYLQYLIDTGAEQEEVTEATKAYEESVDNLELSQARLNQTVRDFLNLQKEIVSAAKDESYTAELERGLEETARLVDNENASLRNRLESNEGYFSLLRELRQNDYDNYIHNLDKQLESGIISQETYNTLVENAQQNLQNDLNQMEEDGARKRIDIIRNTLNSRLQLASDALGALMMLNEAYAGESEAEQRRAFERNKQFSILQAVISTAQAVAGQLAVPQDQLTGVNFIKAGIALATGLAQIKTIQNSTWGGGVNPPAGTNPGNVTASEFDYGALQEAGGEIPFGETSAQPRAYVLQQDISNGLQVERMIERQVRL